MATPKKRINKNKEAQPHSEETKPNTPLNQTSSKVELSSTKLDEEIVNQLLSQVATRYKNEIITDKKIKIKEISHISSMAEEYFSCFALIGYSMQNEEVVVLNTPTPKDEAALVDLLRATFLDIASKRP